MNLLKRIISYSPYLLILLVVAPVIAGAQGTDSGMFETGIKKVLWGVVNNVFGFLIGAAGVLLDFAVNSYVIKFGETWGLNATGVGGAIDESWKIVRDVFNITFIFGLVWIGFKMILNGGDSNARRTLITLILAALLVNFSLFITKFVVDFTNILATEIAEAFVSQNPLTGISSGDAKISEKFMQLFGLSSIFQGTGTSNPLPAGDVTYMYIFGTAIVFLIGAFTFAAGGIMLIIRFAALCIYMVFSPLMFLGWVFPGLQSVSSKYWSGFLGRAFFAPAYLMLIYLAAFVMGSYNSTVTGNNGFRESFTNSNEANVAATIGPFLLTCVFLIASVVVAGKMSADGAQTAISMGKNLTGRAQRGLKNGALLVPRVAVGGTANLSARGMRNSVGLGSNKLVNSEGFKNWAAKSAVGKQAFKAAQAGAKSSFDVRQVGGVGKSLGLGTGKKGGYDKIAKDRAKSDDAFAKAVSANVDFDKSETQIELANKTKEIYKEKEIEKEKLVATKTEAMLKLEQLQTRLAQEQAAGVHPEDMANTIAEINETRSALTQAEQTLFLDIAKADKDMQNAQQIAKGRMKYRNELDYVNQLKRSEQFWKRFLTLPSAGAGGTYAVGATHLAGAGLAKMGAGAGAGLGLLSGAGALGALGGAAGALGNAGLAKAGYSEIEKRIGKDGVKGLKNEEKKKQAKLLQEIMEDNTDKKDKADSSDNDDKE